MANTSSALEAHSKKERTAMRLVRKEGILHAQVTFQWEAAYLAEQGERWLSFCLVGHTEPIGEVHTTTHEIRLYPGVAIADRQAVALSAPR